MEIDKLKYVYDNHQDRFPEVLKSYLAKGPKWSTELEGFIEDVYSQEIEPILLQSLNTINFRSFDPDYNPLADLILLYTKNGETLIELLRKFPIVILNSKFARKVSSIDQENSPGTKPYTVQAVDFLSKSPDRIAVVSSRHLITLMGSDIILFNRFCENISKYKYPPYFRDYFQLIAEVHDAEALFYGYKLAYRVFLNGWSGISSEISSEIFQDSFESNSVDLVDILEKAYEEDLIDTYWGAYVLHQMAKGGRITLSVAKKLLEKRYFREIFLFNLVKIFEDVEDKNAKNIYDFFQINEIFTENITAKKDLVGLSKLFLNNRDISPREVLKKVIEPKSPDKILEDLVLGTRIRKDRDLIFGSVFTYPSFLTDKIFGYLLGYMDNFRDLKKFFKKLPFKKWDIYEKQYMKVKYYQGLRSIFEPSVKKSEIVAFMVLKHISQMNLTAGDKARLYKIARKNCPFFKRIGYHIRYYLG